jgi:phosphatidylglycerophosphatase A
MARSDLKSLAVRLVATAGGAGYSPVAPGTCGTLVGVLIAYACRSVDTCLFVGVALFVTICGVVAADHAERLWGTHDDQRIVIDEVAGYLITVAFVDRSNAWTLAVGFIVFRALDILKPPPVRWFERARGGWGVMLDDVAAGVIGAVIMVILARFGVFAVTLP